MDSTAYKSGVTDAFTRAAGSYDRGGVGFFTPMGRELVRLAAPRPGERVLDVGCGRGAALFPAAEAVGPGGRAVGIDIAATMIEAAREEVRRIGAGNVELLVMDAERPHFPNASFDLVLGGYSILFLPEAPAALARYPRIMAPGGRLAFTCPLFVPGSFPFLPPVFTPMFPPSVFAALPPDWQPDELRRRYNGWLSDVAELEAVLEAAGFTGVEVRDQTVPMTAESPSAWVEWSHTQGMRLLWDRLPVPVAGELRRSLVAGLTELAAEDGSLVIDTPVRFVTAEIIS
ncbi:class I SAM-dependent methyltransferase [Actinomadura violacea]|uniref:Methyltransferase domain-containing protein n=1 Tax=Actinomadura violacea TaxID=2819934 RepID=A0ABS3S124_9ACTN|nr:methyltransferase domain-containing protein [Actinomadura violacea]MBO2462647.1 methyltransferase domain-containing protein [Actinomadura violacea]